MSEKRFYRASVCGDDGLYDKEDGCIIVNVRSNIDLDDNWNTVVEKLNELAEENEQLRKELNMYKVVILQFVGLLAENGIMESSVKEEVDELLEELNGDGV